MHDLDHGLTERDRLAHRLLPGDDALGEGDNRRRVGDGDEDHAVAPASERAMATRCAMPPESRMSPTPGTEAAGGCPTTSTSALRWASAAPR